MCITHMQIFWQMGAKGQGMQLHEQAAGPGLWHNVGAPSEETDML